MPPTERARDRGRRTARHLISELANELREARLAAGLSQRSVAQAAGLTQSRISQTELARRPGLRFDEACRHAAVLGLRLSTKTYPEGTPVRDGPQLRLLERLHVQIHGALGWRTEVLVGGFGDQRAWDAVIDGQGSVGVDAETRLRDIQATQRRCEAKWRDSGVDRIVLLVAATTHNRTVLRAHRMALWSTFPADTAEVMRALRKGELPPRNGIVIL
jgi:transcriptional regulator with XRE-family HTH domain